MENDRSSDRNVVRDFLAQNSEWDDLRDVKFNNSDTPDEILTAGESAEESREDKVRALFEGEYNGEKTFGPQGVVDYWDELRDHFLDICETDTAGMSEEEIEKIRESKLFPIDDKMALVAEYLEKDVWDEKWFGWGGVPDEKTVKGMLASGLSAEAIYSRMLMGGQNLNWEESDWTIYKYGFDTSSGVAQSERLAGCDILSKNVIPILEEQGVKIDGYDILERTNDSLQFHQDKDFEVLFKHGVDVNDVVKRMKENAGDNESEQAAAILRKFDILKNNGADIDIQEIADSMNDSIKSINIYELYMHGADIDVMKLIESDEIIDGEHPGFGLVQDKNAVAVIGYGGIEALDGLRKISESSAKDDYWKYCKANIEEALKDFGLSDEELAEKAKMQDDCDLLRYIEYRKIGIDKKGRYYQRKTLDNGNYDYDYGSEDVKRFEVLQQDKDFFKNMFKYEMGRPVWANGSRYDDWGKGGRSDLFELLETYASVDVINDPEVVEYLAQGCSYPTGRDCQNETYLSTVLCHKMSLTNADKVIRRGIQNGVKFADYVLEAVYGLGGAPFEDEEDLEDSNKITEADIELIKNSNFNGVDFKFDVEKSIDPRSEDKINFYLKDFCNIEGIHGWETANEQDKVLIAQRTANFIANRIGVTRPLRVVASSLDGAYGQCVDWRTHSNVELDLEAIHKNRHEAIVTIAHEVWHAYQHQYADEQDSDVAKIYRKNFENYIDAKKDYVGYMVQPIEEEARRFAEQFKKYVKELEKKLNS